MSSAFEIFNNTDKWVIFHMGRLRKIGIAVNLNNLIPRAQRFNFVHPRETSSGEPVATQAEDLHPGCVMVTSDALHDTLGEIDAERLVDD